MNNQMEITEKERLSREDAAARLHALAEPDEVDFKLEIEFEDEERELEVELKW